MYDFYPVDFASILSLFWITLTKKKVGQELELLTNFEMFQSYENGVSAETAKLSKTKC